LQDGLCSEPVCAIVQPEPETAWNLFGPFLNFWGDRIKSGYFGDSAGHEPSPLLKTRCMLIFALKTNSTLWGKKVMMDENSWKVAET
jgi:hypothetical protein